MCLTKYVTYHFTNREAYRRARKQVPHKSGPPKARLYIIIKTLLNEEQRSKQSYASLLQLMEQGAMWIVPRTAATWDQLDALLLEIKDRDFFGAFTVETRARHSGYELIRRSLAQRGRK